MKKTLLTLVGLAALCFVGAQRVPSRSPLLIKNVTLIDGSGAPSRRHVDVAVKNGRIQEIGPNLTASGARLIDATGKYLIPGLIDVHVHLDAPMVFQLSEREKKEIIDHNPLAFLYNGVTTVLNLSSEAEWIWKLRDDQRAGKIVAPRIFAMGRAFTPVGGWGSRHGGAVASVQEARARAVKYVQRGTDGFKVMIEDGLGRSGTYVEMPDDILNAVVQVGREHHVPIYVHAINLEEYRRAVAIDPRAIEHGLEDPIPAGDSLLKQIVEKHIIIVPTLSLFESFLTMDGSLDDPVLRGSEPAFLLSHMKDPAYLKVEKEKFRKVARIPVYKWARKALPIFRENIRKMHEAGVTLAVGTDAGGPVGFNFQGYNTPWEVELLVDCGLSPMEALVAATRNGARTIGRSQDLGTVEPGKKADLLILSADPLADIRNIRKIDTVVLDGIPHQRREYAWKPEQ